MPIGNTIEAVSLRGGMNDSDPATTLPDDQVANAMNVEFFYSMCGDRRMGCDPLDTSSPFVGQTAITFLQQWFPRDDITNPELWGIGATPGVAGSVPVVYRRMGTLSGAPTWTQVTTIVDSFSPAVPDIYQVQAQALNNKLFFAYNTPNNFQAVTTGVNNGANRFHVWDGSGLRRTGIFQPPVPASAVDEGSGSFVGTRYYRVRYIKQDSNGNVVVRSEPSTSLTLTPSGTGAGATVSRGAVVNDNETHWELEASLDNANFYRIATLSMSTLTYNDENGAYAATFTLSEAIGAYLTQPAAKFVGSDDDRLLLANGSWTDPTAASTVWWSPRKNDPGVGNDERQPIVDTGGTPITSSLQLDPSEGGAITGITNSINSAWYVFKWSHIYKMNRTQDVTRAYEAINISKKRGAVPYSVFEGMDADGRTVIYFLDPVLGPSLLGPAGPEVIYGLRKTWKRVNLKATSVVARGVFYQYKQQARWWVAADGNNTPTLGLCLQVSEMTSREAGGRWRGWSLFNGKLAQATAVCIYNEWVSESGSANLSERPIIGLASPDFVQRTDVDSTDNGTTYTATLTSRAYNIETLLQRFGAITTTLAADASTGTTLQVRLIRDLGVETIGPVAASLTPVGSESIVVVDQDNLAVTGCRFVQFQISDS